ncbi:MAG TPA: ATP-binding protein [Candidatus Coatesbacteria bacterium]|nr:ATP-binding protein [Candidatus Coatesbacteria bacterium]
MGEEKHSARDARRKGEDERHWMLRVAVNRSLDRIRRKLLVFSGKGGVGKSTVAANLAVLLGLAGQRVGLLDIDFHGPSIPALMGLAGRLLDTEGDKAVPLLGPGGVKVVSIGLLVPDGEAAMIWRGPLKMGVINQLLGNTKWGDDGEDDLDWLIIDSPPGTGDEPLSIAQTVIGAQGLLVTTPQTLSTDDVRRSVGFARKVGMSVVGIIENMAGLVCPHCGGGIDLFKRGGGKALAEELGVPFLGEVPLDPRAVEAGDSGKPMVLSLPDSPATKALLAAFKPILEMA